ncbi:ribosome small subunit-dependent GTPase A [Acetobacterium wieringae]|uniref:ribosome small subunit-dependent GTPase A n=1 Tax=Acetobacterium wieringae TaxID=52694 RepID=UPI0026F18D06|nr:ribosome small subunit-dependent GTPase A [Acetobacterium wieringae]
MNRIDLSTYGLSPSLGLEASHYPELFVARILSQSKGIYRVISEQGEFFAELSGRLRYETIEAANFPAVGDFVMLDRPTGEQGNGIIHHLLTRKSVFIRKAAGSSSQAQVIAANIDSVFICMSVNNDFNLRRLERYLSLVWESGATPVVVLTKIDLTEDLLAKCRAAAAIAIGVDILGISTLQNEGFWDLIAYLSAGQTVALLGSSGVGKSTLINWLSGAPLFDTQMIRNDDRGRHTTTRRELIRLADGGMLIDTPGMREIGMLDVNTGFDRTFRDVEAHLDSCRFRNCTHTNEPGCGIATAIKAGQLSAQRWQAYQKLTGENDYFQNKAAFLKKKKEKFYQIARINRNNKKQ